MKIFCESCKNLIEIMVEPLEVMQCESCNNIGVYIPETEMLMVYKN